MTEPAATHAYLSFKDLVSLVRTGQSAWPHAARISFALRRGQMTDAILAAVDEAADAYIETDILTVAVGIEMRKQWDKRMVRLPLARLGEPRLGFPSDNAEEIASLIGRPDVMEDAGVDGPMIWPSDEDGYAMYVEDCRDMVALYRADSGAA